MAGFRTHITVSTAAGVAYGAGAWYAFEIPWPTCLLAGGLCSVSGMLPDVDSDTGTPLRESLAFGAAIVPMMLIERWRTLGFSNELIVLCGAGLYLAIRFGFGAILKHLTVHRGMFHSLPAAAIVTGVAFLVSSGSLEMRLFKSGGVLAGFLSHLLLDEVWSVDLRGLRIKKSFGTALKMWGDNGWANLVTFAQLLLVTLLVLNDPVWIETGAKGEQLHNLATLIMERLRR